MKLPPQLPSELPLESLPYPCLMVMLSFNWIYMLQNLARWLIFAKGQRVVENETDERRKKIRKFKESAWKCVYFVSAEIFALSVTYNEPWFTKTKYFWVGPGDQVWPDQKYK